MIPKGLTYSHFKKAISEIEKYGIPPRRNSYHYYLIFNGKKYPPKYVISIANKIKTGKEWSSAEFNAVEAKNYFSSKGYIIKTSDSGEIKTSLKFEDEEISFVEGKEKYALHKKYERDVKAGKVLKERVMKKYGDLKCEVCNFSFLEAYGELGAGYIEAHHIIPVSQLGENGKTKISDIVLVCANCHKIIHRTRPILSIKKLKKIVENNKRVI